MLRAIWPLFHADKITKPLIILQGKNDPRVLQVESDEIASAIKNKKGVVEYIVFPNERTRFHEEGKQAARLQGDSRFPRRAPQTR